jgi:hypothetical protein
MAATNIRGAQILNNTVQRQDLDTSTVGQAVVTKLIQGSGISLSSTGADSGTGDVTITAPTAWKGVWNSVTAYVTNDQVIRYGSHYIATANNTNVDPSITPGTTNLGNTSQGASSGAFVGISAVKVTVSATGTLQSLSMFQTGSSGTAYNLGLYGDNGSGAPGSLIAQCTPSTSVIGLATLNTTTQPTLTPGSYYVAVMNASGLSGYYNSSGAGFYNNSQSYGTGSMPATWPAASTGAFDFSLYLTMTVGAVSWTAMATGGKAGLSTDSGNLAVAGSDSLILVPQSQIWSVRLRSFNSVGNASMEVDQRNVGTGLTLGTGSVSTMVVDRWAVSKVAATGTVNAFQSGVTNLVVPGTNFYITSRALVAQVGTVQAALGASEYIMIYQQVEGPMLRELLGDVTSLSILANCSQTINFGIALADNGGTHTYVSALLNLPANTWKLFTLPAIPIWGAGGNFPITAGSNGYTIKVCLGTGSTYAAPSTGTWLTGNYVGPSGCTNFLSLPTNSTFQLAFCQHEPGSQATTLIDKPFSQNYDECLRYFTKSYNYGVKPGSVDVNGSPAILVPAGFHPYGHFPFKKTMAKIPTIAGWSPPTGVANSVRDENAGIDRTISGSFKAGDSEFGGFTLTATGSITYYTLHYTADTGW